MLVEVPVNRWPGLDRLEAPAAEFLPLAADAGLQPHVQTYPLADANRALLDLKRGRGRGAKVLTVD